MATVVVVVVVSGSGVTALSARSPVLISFSAILEGGQVRLEQKKRPSIQIQVLQSCRRSSPSLHSGSGFTVVVVVVVVVVVTFSVVLSAFEISGAVIIVMSP